MEFAALLGALALFWLSTRQFPKGLRLLIWAAGLALLAFAALPTILENSRFTIGAVAGDALKNLGSWRASALAQAFALNAPAIEEFFGQILDFFVVAVAVAALLAIFALTPGENVEKALRPALIGLTCFIAGSAATVCVVALGFGSFKPRVFTEANGQIRIHDGDTFWIGEHGLRLYGVDAPELGQICRVPEETDCGAEARHALELLLQDSTLQCRQQFSRRSQRPLDSFGRALVSCSIYRDGAPRDLGDALVRAGWAVQYEGDADYGYSTAEEAGARAREAHLGCTLRPDVWRRNEEAVAAFKSRVPLPAEARTTDSCEL